MWPVLGNFFLHNNNLLKSQRTINTDIPNLPQVFEICKKGKIVFADIVKGINDEIEAFEIPQQNHVLVNNEYDWCSREINKSIVGAYADTHLDIMGNKGWLSHNVEEIIKYINNTPSLKHIYFTFKTGTWLVSRRNEICQRVRPDVSSCSIFTPTAKGFGQLLLPPFDQRAWGLSHCWVWNGLDHNFPINRSGYGHLDHNWLIEKGVNPNNF